MVFCYSSPSRLRQCCQRTRHKVRYNVSLFQTQGISNSRKRWWTAGGNEERSSARPTRSSSALQTEAPFPSLPGREKVTPLFVTHQHPYRPMLEWWKSRTWHLCFTVEIVSMAVGALSLSYPERKDDSYSWQLRNSVSINTLKTIPTPLTLKKRKLEKENGFMLTRSGKSQIRCAFNI